MSKERITLEQLNRLRHSYFRDEEYSKEIVMSLIVSEVLSDSNDYMLAQYALIAGYYWAMGMTEEGRPYIEKAMTFAEYATDKVSLIDVYILAGNYASLNERYNEMLSIYLRALDLSEEIGYKADVSRIYNNIGSIYFDTKNYEKALSYLLLAEKYSKRYTEASIISIIYNNLAECYLMLEQTEDAKTYLDSMDGMIVQNSSTIDLLFHLINKLRYALMLENQAQAETIYIEARKLLGELPFGNDYIMANLAIFDVLVDMGNDVIAVESLERNIHMLEEAQDYHKLKKFYSKLIMYYKCLGEDEKRSYYINKSYENELLREQVQMDIMNRSLEQLDLEHKKKEEERIKNATAYSALSDENAKLLAVNNNLRAIHDIGLKLLSTTNLEEIFKLLFDKVNALFQVKEFAVGILNEDKSALLFKYSSNDSGVSSSISMKTKEVKLSALKSISVKCLLENKEIIINDCEREDPERFQRNLEKGERLATLVFLPIVINDKPVGVITAQHHQKNAFNSLHLEVFRLLATFAAVSFKNAKHNIKLTEEIDKRIDIQGELEDINRRLDHLAKHDDLTGIYNRRTFEIVYQEIFEDARNKGLHLTVMILDIDHFKEYNDYYGHLKGDTCIVDVSNQLRENLNRRDDFIARYGGDEFLIILPETDEEGANHMANKLVQCVRSLKIPHVKSKVSDIVTISLGAVSVMVAIDDNPDSLLIAADKALYKVKHELGRNNYFLTARYSSAQ